MSILIEIAVPDFSLMSVDMFLDASLPVVEVVPMATSVVDVIGTQSSMMVEIVAGSIKGDKGDKGNKGDKGDAGSVDNYDPGDITIALSNALI